MSRPPRQRTVTSGLAEGVFAPRGIPLRDLATVDLTLDGLEALRLVDLEGLYQEAAAERMGISRATLARVLLRARRAVAQALVEQSALAIGGGSVRQGPAGPWPCPVHGAGRRRGRGCRCGGGGAGRGGPGRGRRHGRGGTEAGSE
jgi:predicted DNA-binding protein (UPF0251 family)